jgi:hypothetical protein
LTSLVSAIQKARALGDLTAEIYFRTFLGNGLVANNRPAQALPMFDEAIALGTKSPDSGYPIMPVIGKVRALRALKKSEDALRLIEDRRSATPASTRSLGRKLSFWSRRG